MKTIAIIGISLIITLGIFVNPIFLYIGLFLACPLMHIFMGEHNSHLKTKRKSKMSNKHHLSEVKF